MTSIIIFAPVLFYRLLIFRSFFALGGQLIILHGNDNGIAFFYLICQDHLGCQGLHVLLDITRMECCREMHIRIRTIVITGCCFKVFRAQGNDCALL